MSIDRSADVIRPLGDWVLIVPKNDERKYGVLILPNTRTGLVEAEVLAVGEGANGKPLKVHQGDVCLFSPESPSGTKAVLPLSDGRPAMLVREHELVAVIERKSKVEN